MRALSTSVRRVRLKEDDSENLDGIHFDLTVTAYTVFLGKEYIRF